MVVTDFLSWVCLTEYALRLIVGTARTEHFTWENLLKALGDETNLLPPLQNTFSPNISKCVFRAFKTFLKSDIPYTSGVLYSLLTALI